jgi:hypothetical protein
LAGFSGFSLLSSPSPRSGADFFLLDVDAAVTERERGVVAAVEIGVGAWEVWAVDGAGESCCFFLGSAKVYMYLYRMVVVVVVANSLC